MPLYTVQGTFLVIQTKASKQGRQASDCSACDPEVGQNMKNYFLGGIESATNLTSHLLKLHTPITIKSRHAPITQLLNLNKLSRPLATHIRQLDSNLSAKHPEERATMDSSSHRRFGRSQILVQELTNQPESCFVEPASLIQQCIHGLSAASTVTTLPSRQKIRKII